MNNLEVLRKRNLLMAKIMWIMSFIYIVFSVLAGIDKKGVITIAPILVGISILLSVLVWRKIIEDKIKYIAAVGLCITHFLFVLMFHDLDGFLIAFVVMVAISLYQSYKTTDRKSVV